MAAVAAVPALAAAGCRDDSFSESQTDRGGGRGGGGGGLFSLSDVETNRLRSHRDVPERNLLVGGGSRPV